VPDVETVVLAKDVDVSGHRRRLAEADGDADAPLRVELSGLAEVADAIEEAEPGRMCHRHLPQLFLEVEPDWHRLDPDVLAREARQEELAAVLRLEERSESVRHLESSLVIDTCG